MTAIMRSKGSLKWWVLACILAVAIGVGFTAFHTWSTTQDKYTSQANAETLAQDITQICDRDGTFVINNRDLCIKGENVLTDPTSPIPGPKGEPGNEGQPGKDGLNGKDGLPGKDGKNGLNGKDGLPGKDGLNGKDGLPGKDGLNGANGLDGKDGLNGANGTDGKDGTNGTDGKDGQSVTYFTWTDSKTGQKYNCVPEPAGSSTFTCTAEESAPPPPPPAFP